MLISDNLPERVLDRYPTEAMRLRETIECAWRSLQQGRKHGTRTEMVAAAFVARGVTLAEASYNLFCLGYENSLAIIVRSLAELAIDCAYISCEDTDERVGAYLWHSVDGIIKTAEAFGQDEAKVEQLLRQIPHDLAGPALTTVEEARRWAKKEFGPRREWTTLALPDRARAAGADGLYGLLYRLGCLEAHSNGAALPVSGTSVDALVMNIGAHMPKTATWASSAAMCLFVILNGTGDIIGGDLDGIRRLGADWLKINDGFAVDGRKA